MLGLITGIFTISIFNVFINKSVILLYPDFNCHILMINFTLLLHNNF